MGTSGYFCVEWDGKMYISGQVFGNALPRDIVVEQRATWEYAKLSDITELELRKDMALRTSYEHVYKCQYNASFKNITT
jgi:hypothetical protein